jgi:hypothetical protein
MIQRNARFYFANLGADIVRCISVSDNPTRYKHSLDRVWLTLNKLRTVERPEAYEEGLLLTRALEYARRTKELNSFRSNVNKMIEQIMLLQSSSVGSVATSHNEPVELSS